MVRPLEIELKLELDPSTLAGGQGQRAVRRLPLLRDGGETRRLVSLIYDTEDQALRKRGLVFRVRRAGDRRIQTLKADLGSGSLERAEWECEISGEGPDLAAIPDADLRREVEGAGALAPVLETAVDRTIWHLRHNGSDVELSFDEGMIRVGNRIEPVHEIELELKTGAPSALFSLAREIVGTVPARPGMRSKSERGYDLLAGTAPPKAEPYRIDRKMNVAASFQAIVRACLRQYLANEPGILAREAEALHKGRVALRRLRSCLKLHKKLIADPEGERLKQALRRLSQNLGEARNLDVYLDRIDAGTVPGSLRAEVATERERVYARLTAMLRAKGMRLLLVDLMAYAETGAWLRDPERRKLRETGVRKFAKKTLEKRWRRLVEAGRDLAGQTPEARHEVRIDGKVLRYASEFFAGAFSGKKSKKRRTGLLDALTDLQTHLGDLNDIEVGASLVADLPDVPVPPPDPQRIAELVAAAQGAHGKIENAKPFWE